MYRLIEVGFDEYNVFEHYQQLVKFGGCDQFWKLELADKNYGFAGEFSYNDTSVGFLF